MFERFSRTKERSSQYWTVFDRPTIPLSSAASGGAVDRRHLTHSPALPTLPSYLPSRPTDREQQGSCCDARQVPLGGKLDIDRYGANRDPPSYGTYNLEILLWWQFPSILVISRNLTPLHQITILNYFKYAQLEWINSRLSRQKSDKHYVKCWG